MEIEIGKWWPELGRFDEWLNRKLEEARKQYVVQSHSIIDNYRGGYEVIAKVQAKAAFERQLDKMVEADIEHAKEVSR